MGFLDTVPVTVQSVKSTHVFAPVWRRVNDENTYNALAPNHLTYFKCLDDNFSYANKYSIND